MPPFGTVPGGSICVPSLVQLPGKLPFAWMRVKEANRANIRDVKDMFLGRDKEEMIIVIAG
jgi:hypothetical protein